MNCDFGEYGYHSLDYEMKKQFGKKVYRLALDAGCTCPNRDGTCGVGGCIFCADSEYSQYFDDDLKNVFDETYDVMNVRNQIDLAKCKVAGKTKENAYIAYFQSHTGTYGDINRLCGLYREAIMQPDIVALSIGTRPDCISDEWIVRLRELNEIKPVWIELGLQTINDRTAEIINRGYTLSVFEETYRKLKEAGLTVIVHVIIGLPLETEEDAEKTVKYLAGLVPVLDGIKLHNLNILEGTKLCKMYRKDASIIHEYTMEEYLALVVRLIRLLPPETVIHRITGDGSRKLLVTPKWITDKKKVQNTFRKMMADETLS